MSLSQFLTNLSNLSNQQYSLSFLVTTADLVDMQTLIHAATIHLHRDALETQSQSYQKCVWAANAMTSMIRAMADNDYDLLCPIIAVRCFASVGARGLELGLMRDHIQTCWRSAAEVYLRIRTSSQGQPLSTTTDLIEQELDTLIAALQRLSLAFPIAGEHNATPPRLAWTDFSFPTRHLCCEDPGRQDNSSPTLCLAPRMTLPMTTASSRTLYILVSACTCYDSSLDNYSIRSPTRTLGTSDL